MNPRNERTPTVRALPVFGFLLALGILLLVGLLIYRDTLALLDAEHWVEHTHEVIEQLDGIVADTGELATRRRAFAITGDPGEIAPWDALKARIERRRQSLATLIADNAAQIRRRERLRPLLDARLAQLDTALRDRQTLGFRREHESEMVIEGTALERQVRTTIDEMTAEERQLLAVREAEERRRAARMIRIVLVGFGSAAVLLLAVMELLRREIRQRAQGQRALGESEGRLAGILSSLGEGVIAVDTAGRIARMNPVAEEITGWPAREAEGQPLESVLRLRDEKTRASLPDPAKPLLAGESARGTELEALLEGRGEKVLAVGVVATPMLDAGGHVVGAVTVLRDVTRERALQAQFRRILESTPDAIVIVDRHGKIVLVNDQVVPLFGYERDELLGQTVELLVPDRIRKLHVGDRERYHQNPVTRAMGHGRTLYARKKDGTEFPADISLSPIETPNERLAIAAVRDVSVRVQNEADLRRARDAAEGANRELEAFSYSVAHDLRAPLRSIDGFSQALLEDYADKVDESGRDYLKRVRAAAQRMALLIDDLLSLSRVSRSVMKHERVDLTKIARDVADRLREAEPGRAVEVSVQDGMVANADARLVGVVLENLLGNAWKFTAKREGARIEVGEQKDAERPTFYVKDNGAGFDMAYVGKLFGAFQRLHRESDYQGTGIGLATVQRIVHRHGGRVWAEGVVNQGATFYFSL